LLLHEIKNDRDFGRFCSDYSALKIERSEHQADNLVKLRIESLSVFEPIAKRGDSKVKIQRGSRQCSFIARFLFA